MWVRVLLLYVVWPSAFVHLVSHSNSIPSLFLQPFSPVLTSSKIIQWQSFLNSEMSPPALTSEVPSVQRTELSGRQAEMPPLCASFYRSGAARGWERGGSRGGRGGDGSRAAPSAAPPAGPEKRRSGPGLARSCRDARKGAHRVGAPGKGAVGRGVRGFLTPALGQSRRLRVPRETGGEHSASLGDD